MTGRSVSYSLLMCGYPDSDQFNIESGGNQEMVCRGRMAGLRMGRFLMLLKTEVLSQRSGTRQCRQFFVPMDGYVEHHIHPLPVDVLSTVTRWDSRRQ